MFVCECVCGQIVRAEPCMLCMCLCVCVCVSFVVHNEALLLDSGGEETGGQISVQFDLWFSVPCANHSTDWTTESHVTVQSTKYIM